MNKKISTLLGILLILLAALLVVVLVWQNWFVPEYGVLPIKVSPKPSEKEFTIGLDEEAKIIYETEVSPHLEFLISLKNIDISTKSVQINLKSEPPIHCGFPEARRFGGRPPNTLSLEELQDTAYCFTTEECSANFKLISLENTKAIFETWEGCAPPGPKGPFLPKEIIIRKIAGVTIATDKTEYVQGETIKITLKNNLKESIFSHIGSGTPAFCIEYIERYTPAGDWEKLFAQCQYPNCIYDIDAPAEIKPGQSVAFEWDVLIFVNGTSETVQAGPGRYRLSILYEDYRKTEWKSAYSNEFTIK